MYQFDAMESAYHSAKYFHDWYHNPPYKKRIKYISDDLKTFYKQGIEAPEKFYNLKRWAKQSVSRPKQYFPSNTERLKNFFANALMHLRITLITLSDSEIKNFKKQFDKVCKEKKVGLYRFHTYTKKW